MKKLAIISALVLCTTASYSQQYWRTLTVNQISGTDFKGGRFSLFSAGLHYDLPKKFYISNWTGLQVNYSPQKTSWFNTQTTVNRYVNRWNFGAGVQYGMLNLPGTPYSIANGVNSTYFIVTTGYRFKLN